MMMKLIGMMDSPYVRRVAVSLELYGIEFNSMPLSVFSTFEAFSQINPVVKAPTVIMDSGLQLMDSTLILHYFEALSEADHKLLPENHHALAKDLQILGIILAACEKAVQNIYEHNLRPAEKQYQPWIDRVTRQLLAACREWNALLEGRATVGRPDQVSVTSTVVWSFIQFMIPMVVPADSFKNIRSIAESCEAMSAFKKYPVC
jgi:glutathione S-transferase